MHLNQQRAVCSQGRQGHVTKLLAAVCCVLLQAGTVWGQGGHTMVMDPSAIWDVNLCHILPPRGYFHQEIIVYLGDRGTPGEIKVSRNTKKTFVHYKGDKESRNDKIWSQKQLSILTLLSWSLITNHGMNLMYKILNVIYKMLYIKRQKYTLQLKLKNNTGGECTLYKDSTAYLLKATEVDLLPELEVQAEVPPVLTHQWGTQTALLHRQVGEHLKKHKELRNQWQAPS